MTFEPDTAAAVVSTTRERLRAYRREQARDRPVYHVLDNATLERLLQVRPRTIDALARVPGMGPRRIEEHGKALLAILAELPDVPRGSLRIEVPAGLHADLADAAAEGGRGIEEEVATAIRLHVVARRALLEDGYRPPRARRPPPDTGERASEDRGEGKPEAAGTPPPGKRDA